jgi:hypothetical protein
VVCTHAGCGTTSDALSIGGYNGSAGVNKTEKWGGSSWATTANLNNIRYGLVGCGTTSDSLSFGGYTGTFANTTEIYNGTA